MTTKQGSLAREALVFGTPPDSPKMTALRDGVPQEWAAVLDVETRFPNALERAMEHAGSA